MRRKELAFGNNKTRTSGASHSCDTLVLLFFVKRRSLYEANGTDEKL